MNPTNKVTDQEKFEQRRMEYNRRFQQNEPLALVHAIVPAGPKSERTESRAFAVYGQETLEALQRYGASHVWVLTDGGEKATILVSSVKPHSLFKPQVEAGDDEYVYPVTRWEYCPQPPNPVEPIAETSSLPKGFTYRDPANASLPYSGPITHRGLSEEDEVKALEEATMRAKAKAEEIDRKLSEDKKLCVSLGHVWDLIEQECRRCREPGVMVTRGQALLLADIQQPGATRVLARFLMGQEQIPGDPIVHATIGERVNALADEQTAVWKEKLDAVYKERNACVGTLAHLAARLGYTVRMGTHYPCRAHPDWHDVVFVELPTGQVSWHLKRGEKEELHLSRFPYVSGLGGGWDGHTTEKKYARMRLFNASTEVTP